MLIPFAIGNSAFAEIYSNDDYLFSINYPDQWIFNDEIVIYEDGRTTPIEFWDNVDGWVTNVQIDQIEDDFQISSKVDNANIYDVLKNKLETRCQNASQEIEGFICTDFRMLEFRILIIDEIESYQLKYSWTENYSDEEVYKNISYYTVILKDETTWIISSKTLEEHFPEHGKTVQDMIKSFKIINAKIVEEDFQTTLSDEEENSFIGLIITTVNSMLNMVFELADDLTLQDWGNDVINNVAGRTEAKIQNQLGYDPTSLKEMREHVNSKSKPNNQQPEESLPEITSKPKRQPLPESKIIPEPEPKLLNSEPKTPPNYQLPVVEVKQYPNTITYTYQGLASGIDKNIVLDATTQAFRNWEKANPELDFEYSKDTKSDIMIKWQIYSNPDHDGLATITLVNDKPILGKGTITASLGSTDCRGDYIQFDSGKTTNILMHEVGHIIGLGHHMDENHLMYDPGFTSQTEFDDMGFEIPEIFDNYFVGQDKLVEKADALKKEYDAIYDQYKKYEEKPIPSSEYTTAISLQMQITALEKEYYQILQEAKCYPNFS